MRTALRLRLFARGSIADDSVGAGEDSGGANRRSRSTATIFTSANQLKPQAASASDTRSGFPESSA